MTRRNRSASQAAGALGSLCASDCCAERGRQRGHVTVLPVVTDKSQFYCCVCRVILQQFGGSGQTVWSGPLCLWVDSPLTGAVVPATGWEVNPTQTGVFRVVCSVSVGVGAGCGGACLASLNMSQRVRRRKRQGRMVGTRRRKAKRKNLGRVHEQDKSSCCLCCGNKKGKIINTPISTLASWVFMPCKKQHSYILTQTEETLPVQNIILVSNWVPGQFKSFFLCGTIPHYVMWLH